MKIFLIIFMMLVRWSLFAQSKIQLDSMTQVLESVSGDDQKYRLTLDSTIRKYGLNSDVTISLIKRINFQDSINMNIVGRILDGYGWLSKEQTSKVANEAMFLVIQHAPLKSQIKYLSVMKKAVSEKKANPPDYALLVDRTNMYQGKLQIYGSQLNYDAIGNLHVYPILNEPKLNKRRKSVGLMSMQEYIGLIDQNLTYKLPKTDKNKNKVIVKGSILDNRANQPIPNASIYSAEGKLLFVTDSSGFYQVSLAKKVANQTLCFKKENFEIFYYKVDPVSKQVYEVNIILETK